MLDRLKIPFFIIGSLVILFFGYRTFLYFTHNAPPQVILVGIEHEGSYKGEIQCVAQAKNDYKIATIATTLDGKMLPSFPKVVQKAAFEIPFSINTQELENGEHILEVDAIDSSYNANRAKQSWRFSVDNSPLDAAFLQTNYKIDQGRVVHALVRANKRLAKVSMTYSSKSYDCYPENESATTYECFIPTDCEDQAGQYPLMAQVFDEVGNTLILNNTVEIVQFPFKRSTSLRIAAGKLDEEKELSANTKILEDACEKWLKDSPKRKLWSGSFIAPCEIKQLTTPFGEIRVTPEKGRYIHKAVDICDMPRSVVWASQDGRVIIKDRFLFPGNVVVLDHGLGVFTMYSHLEDFAEIEVGDIIKKGSPIGRIGKTGYASGYHLHWELRVNNVAVDPLQWLEKSF